MGPFFTIIVQLLFPRLWVHYALNGGRMQERRKRNRTSLMSYSQVFDLHGGRLLGYLADLTESGAMVIGSKQVQEDLELTLTLEVPELPNVKLETAHPASARASGAAPTSVPSSSTSASSSRMSARSSWPSCAASCRSMSSPATCRVTRSARRRAAEHPRPQGNRRGVVRFLPAFTAPHGRYTGAVCSRRSHVQGPT